MSGRVIVSGGFDPLHAGHIELIHYAHVSTGFPVIVLVNSDEWLIRKKGRNFMSFQDRCTIVRNLKHVEEVYAVDDTDGTVVSGLAMLRDMYGYPLVFANGGDRQVENTPEFEFCQSNNIAMRFGVGGEKRQSSSNLLQDWKEPSVRRTWGKWSVLKEYLEEDKVVTKVKELVVYPGESLSLQRHELRSELWSVAEGIATVEVGCYTDYLSKFELSPGEFQTIARGVWHRLSNNTQELLKIVEIQYGENCIEEDIERVLERREFNTGEII